MKKKYGSTSAPKLGTTLVKSLGASLLAISALSAHAAEYKIVLLQSLTGASAFIGAPFKDGALIAVDEVNQQQLLGAGNTLKVEVVDDATDRTQTLSLLRRYAADPNVLMVLGPTSGAVAVAGAAAANDLKLPVLTTSNSTDVLKAGPWSFILTQPGDFTVPHMANYAVDKLKVRNCTVIGIHDVEIYLQMQKVFEKIVKEKGVKINSVESIKGSDSDFGALATKVVNDAPDCIFISAVAAQAANIIIQLRQAGLDPETKIIGHNALSSPQLLERGGKAVEGVYFIGDWVPGGTEEQGKRFSEAWRAKHKSEADNWAAIGYTGIQIVTEALKNAGTPPAREGVRDALGKIQNVQVPVGTNKVTYDAERRPNWGMRVLQVKDGTFIQAP